MDLSHKFHHAYAITSIAGGGKSTLLKLAKKHGFCTISADEIAHKLLDRHADKLAQIFGKQILNDADINATTNEISLVGKSVAITKTTPTSAINTATSEITQTSASKINRQKLGDIVFDDPGKREILNTFMHSRIRRVIYLAAARLERLERPYFVEIPLLYESGAYGAFERVVLVYAPQELCIKRLMHRSGYSQQKAQQIISAQMPIEQKLARAKYTIYNDCGYDEFCKRCERFLRSIDV